MRREPLVHLPEALLHPAQREGARYVMGVDGGATKTLAAVLDLDTLTPHVAHGGPSNEDVIGPEAAVQALLQVADEALARAGIEQAELAMTVLAVAGTDTDSLARHLRTRRTEDWVVVNDVVAAWAVATGARPGIGAISGTGSNVFGVGPGGRTWRAGGWGHLLGDEGSGYWLGIHSISAALRDRDASGPETALTSAALDFFGLKRPEDLATLVYAKPLTKGEIAALATETARVAHAGDAVALALFERAARALGEQIAVVIHECALAERNAGEFPVGLIGSAFKAGAVFIDPLVANVLKVAPQARVHAVEMAPVVGSLLLAAHGCGRELQATVLAERVDAILSRPAPRPA